MRGLSQGSIDVPLNPNGMAQARAAAATLRGRGIASLVASPLSRARVTAQIVAAAIGVAVQIDPDLVEVQFGGQEGQPLAPWFGDWIAGRYTPEGTESFAALRARAVAAINRLLVLPSPLLVVGHGAFFRALRTAMGLAPTVRLENATPLHCQPDGATWRLTPG